MHRRPRRIADLTRRDWFRAVGAGATTLAIGCGDNLAPTQLGTAILEPDEHGFIVAVWGDRTGTVDIEVRTDGVVVRDAEVELDPTAGNTAALTIYGLAPGREHEIAVSAGTAPPRTSRARTAPLPTDPRPIRLAVSADYDPNPEFASSLVDHVLEAAPELFVSLGDFPYTDNGPVATTVPAYRARHAEARTSRAARQLFEGVGVRAIYDDHEFRNDWDAARVLAEPARYVAAIRVWDEFFPVRDPVGEVRYRSWRWGANAECFLLDCRRFRSANADSDGPDKTMLGHTQLAWLIDAVAQSTATFKLVFTSVPLDFGIGDDHWAAFASERELLLSALVGVPGILFLAADQHWFAAHRHAYGVREIQVGPLARGLGVPGASAPGVLFRGEQLNAGLLDIAPDRLVVTGLGADGERFYKEALTPDDLTPR